MFGRFFHIVVDAILISMCLSGIKRHTGLTPTLRRVPNKDIRNLIRLWLETGEWVSVLDLLGGIAIATRAKGPHLRKHEACHLTVLRPHAPPKNPPLT